MHSNETDKAQRSNVLHTCTHTLTLGVVKQAPAAGCQVACQAQSESRHSGPPNTVIYFHFSVHSSKARLYSFSICVYQLCVYVPVSVHIGGQTLHRSYYVCVGMFMTNCVRISIQIAVHVHERIVLALHLLQARRDMLLMIHLSGPQTLACVLFFDQNATLAFVICSVNHWGKKALLLPPA